MAVHSAPQDPAGGRRFLVIGVPAVVIAIVVAAVVVFLRTPAPALERDGDLCLIDDLQVAERAVLLLDFRKPLAAGGQRLVRESLDHVVAELPKNAELQVFALSDTSAAPRQFIDRLCKPHDQTELAGGGIGCNALPSELPEREAALSFCTRHDALQASVEGMAGQHLAGPVANAYLVEAIEETSLEFADTPGPKSLYLFSDMIQHARWYSHAERRSTGPSFSSFSEFDRLRSEQSASVGPRPAPVGGIDVTVFYIPRSGATVTAEERRRHTRFWQDYMADAFGTAPVFHQLTAMPAFEVIPLFGQPTDAEAAALERELLQRQREEAERLLAQVERERSALQEARRNALAQAEAALEAQRQRERELAAATQAATDAASTRPIAAAAMDDAPQETPAAPALPQLEVTGTAPEALVSPGNRLAVGDQASAAIDDAGTRPVNPPSAERADAAIAAVSLPQPESPEVPPPDADSPAIASSNTFCTPRLKSRFANAQPKYPRRWVDRFATATMVVRFVVDEEGNTVDAEVAVDRERSVANPEVSFDDFAGSAGDWVSLWEFDFDETPACTRRQALERQFDYRYR